MRTVFPTKVWEPTGITDDGITLWSSRTITRDDIRRRADMLTWLDRELPQDERQAARERLHPW